MVKLKSLIKESLTTNLKSGDKVKIRQNLWTDGDRETKQNLKKHNMSPDKVYVVKTFLYKGKWVKNTPEKEFNNQDALVKLNNGYTLLAQFLTKV